MIKDIRVKSLLQKYQTVHSLRSLLVLSNWDIETYMPQNGIEARGKITSIVESHIQHLSLDPEYVIDLKAVKGIEHNKSLTDSERAIIWHLWHDYEKFIKLPKEFVEEYANLTATSSSIWAKARKENNFKMFEPYLKKIFEMTKRMADHIGYQDHPYEALIEDYEPGMKILDYEKYFIDLKNILSQFDFTKGEKLPKLPHEFSVDKLKNLCEKILFLLKSNTSSLRIDESAHPFTNSIGINDVRITTNYNKSSPLSAIYSTIHEFGHGLFALQTSKELEFTPIFEGISYGLHESQSRYWENIIGRSQQFIKWLAPYINTLSDEYKDITSEQLYKYANYVAPSLIRIEADELTYHYHILIRYEIEKALLEGSVNVEDAPELWKVKYQEYLGIKPETDADGIMQDIHWSLGLIGYFPSYSLGTVLSSSIAKKVEKDNPSIISDVIDDESIPTVQLWLKDNIHKYAGTYNYKEVSKKITGEEISLTAWEKYIKAKYKNLLKNN